MTKKIEIEIPDGKRAEWVNGVLTLVDDTPKDVRDRIKTFEDACAELGDVHPFVTQYRCTAALYKGKPMTEDLIAHLKLRIITAALNEGWAPDWTKDGEYKYYPWFCLYTEDAYNDLDDDDKEKCCRVVGRSNIIAYASGGHVDASAYYASSYTYTNGCYRLAFKTRELALYAGKQFIDIYADYCLTK